MERRDEMLHSRIDEGDGAETPEKYMYRAWESDLTYWECYVIIPLTEGTDKENPPANKDNEDACSKHIGNGASTFLFGDAAYSGM